MRVRLVLFCLCVAPGLVASSAAQKAPAPARDGSRLYYYATPRSALDTEVRAVPATDSARFDRLRALFQEQGCSGRQLEVQAVGKKQDGPANLICTWPGQSAASVVVVADYLREGKGESVVENWSGAALLPRLYLAMQARPRQNNWVFVESAGKAGGLTYVHSLTGEQKKQVRAMVAVTSLGVSPVLFYYSPDPEDDFLPAPLGRLEMALALATLSDRLIPRPAAMNPWRWLPYDGTEAFRDSHIPTILLHSIPLQDRDLPGSAHDTADAIDGDAYFKNYQAIAVFLAGLDALAGKLKSDDPVWHGEGGQFHLNPDNLPYIH